MTKIKELIEDFKLTKNSYNNNYLLKLTNNLIIKNYVLNCVELYITHIRGKGGMLNQILSEGLRGRSATTIKTYAHAIQQFESWLDGAGTKLSDYARSDVQQYIDYLSAKKKSASTINKLWNAIKSYSNWA